MLEKHPVETLYEHLTHILEHALPPFEHFDGACSCCGREAKEFNYEAYSGKEYGVTYRHCKACELFKVTDIEVMGIERSEKVLADGTKTGVGHKFGMFAGTGALIQADGTVTLFTPPGTYKKLPESLLSRFDVKECSEYKQIVMVAAMELAYPVLYVKNFGKKTRQLVTGLRYSLNEQSVVACTDSGNCSTTISVNTLDLAAIREIVALAGPIPLSEFKGFKTKISALSYGGINPGQFTTWMRDKGTDAMLAIYRLLPKDPHVRLSWMDLVLKIKEGA